MSEKESYKCNVMKGHLYIIFSILKLNSHKHQECKKKSKMM